MSTRMERQEAVCEWGTKAFGAEHMQSVKARSVQFLEEAIELYQACGGDLAMAHKLLDYVFSRPVGVLHKELGGVGVTLLALAGAAEYNADAEEQLEVERVMSSDPAIFAERNRQKNAAGFDAPGINDDPMAAEREAYISRRRRE